jgi:uncharacterized protein
MKSALKHKNFNLSNPIQEWSNEAWGKISAFWPLRNLIAVNPLQGLEYLPFDQALVEGAAYFQQENLPEGIKAVNRETIKWCQAFFDAGQATISMPLRDQGLYHSWRQLARWDSQLHQNDFEKKNLLETLPELPEDAILESLIKLRIPEEQAPQFLTLLLTTLPGWSSHIQYHTQWSNEQKSHPITHLDYLAIRIVITSLLWSDAIELITWYNHGKAQAQIKQASLKTILENERVYRSALVKQLTFKTPTSNLQRASPLAQVVFCIDVRSEPFRRALEAQGHYETYGFAGFFGIPMEIKHETLQETYPSCPVLLKPKHRVTEQPICSHSPQGHETIRLIKRLYQSAKYTFTTPFALAETLGFFSGVWISLRSLFPNISASIKAGVSKVLSLDEATLISVDTIPFEDQYAYAGGALKMMGLTKDFAPLVVFCGHGSTSLNNAYATALDCGACGGRHGDSNAKVLASILNNQRIRERLRIDGIDIPHETLFIAAKHNTTTDEVIVYDSDVTDEEAIQKLTLLKQDLDKSREINSTERTHLMGFHGKRKDSVNYTKSRSIDWAETRPEWGLACNASFIVAPRSFTHDINLGGRAFLHSYDWQQDPDGKSLTAILTAPMVVAQWINSQYLFSTLDNVAFGSGSKVTNNITGKVGIMQGNASDLMHGLPLQSVYKNDIEKYHEPLRLLTLVYAPRHIITPIIHDSPVLKRLFGNEWVHLVCVDPQNQNIYTLDRTLSWQPHT